MNNDADTVFTVELTGDAYNMQAGLLFRDGPPAEMPSITRLTWIDRLVLSNDRIGFRQSYNPGALHDRGVIVERPIHRHYAPIAHYSGQRAMIVKQKETGFIWRGEINAYDTTFNVRMLRLVREHVTVSGFCSFPGVFVEAFYWGRPIHMMEASKATVVAAPDILMLSFDGGAWRRVSGYNRGLDDG